MITTASSPSTRSSPGVTGLRFTVRWRGARLGVDIGPHVATYSLAGGPPEGIEIRHNETMFRLAGDDRVSRPVCPVRPLTPPPTQPVGRSPKMTSPG